MGQPGSVGILAGSTSLIGGHGTTIAWASEFVNHGVSNALEIGIAAATLGLVIASLLGGPIAKDRTHFFISYDQTNRDEPITRSLDTPGIYDLITQRGAEDPRFLPLLDGYDRNADGSATGLFLRSVDNSILFGKLDHQFSDSVSGSLRANLTDYERFSTFKDEESEKFEKRS